jgi:hypothetical protein
MHTPPIGTSDQILPAQTLAPTGTMPGLHPVSSGLGYPLEIQFGLLEERIQQVYHFHRILEEP